MFCAFHLLLAIQGTTFGIYLILSFKKMEIFKLAQNVALYVIYIARMSSWEKNVF